LVEEKIYDDSFGQWHEDNMFPYKDPFAAGLEIVSGVKFSDLVKFVPKFFFEKTLTIFVHFLLKSMCELCNMQTKHLHGCIGILISLNPKMMDQCRVGVCE